ncbi:unnamed protein product [Danaus chrysippus]|uniref:(African queen) hypothetical protein n=1 Tax=Danaus chrysippus TaxID=151541 RepID=A0A8J2R9R9_9NEOP|nr:unnamed protein product [Danaus chrysippus]
MSLNYKNSTEAFSQYLQSMVKLEELQKMTDDLDKELEDSQRVMAEMKTMFDSIPNTQSNMSDQNSGLRHEDLSQFLLANVPKLLMPDMPENTVDVDLDNVIAMMKCYAEDLRKNFVVPQPQKEQPHVKIENINLEPYATSLDHLVNRLAKIKLNKNIANNKNMELEAKLTQLCDDVNMFTQMVQAKTKLGEVNKNWTPAEQNTTALQYDDLINKLLMGINEVTYLLKNKN